MAREGKSLGPAVISGQLVYTSVSAITTFDPSQFGGCNRRWHFEKIQGIKPPQTKSQDRGTKMHAEIEAWQKDGADVLSPLARAGKHFLPDHSFFKRGVLLVETPFGDHEKLIELRTREITAKAPISILDAKVKAERALTANRVPLVGYIDNLITSGEWIDNEGEHRIDGKDSAEVGDHKSTKSIMAYAKAGTDLIETVQMAGYGKLVRLRFPEKKRVRLSHNYFQTEGRPVAEKRSAIFPLERVDREWERVEGIVREMADVARETEIKKVSPHLESCTAYRGCPHRAICPKSAETLIVMALGKGHGMSLLDRKKAETAKAAGKPAPSTTTNVKIESAAPPAKTGGLARKGATASAPAATTKPTPGVDPAKAAEIEKKRKALEAEIAAAEAAERGEAPEAPEEPTDAPEEPEAPEAPEEPTSEVVDVTCEACGEELSDANLSVLPDGSNFHVGCRFNPIPASEATKGADYIVTFKSGDLVCECLGEDAKTHAIAFKVKTTGGVAKLPGTTKVKPAPEPETGVLPKDAPKSGTAAKTAEPVPAESLPTLDPKVKAAAEAHAKAEASKAAPVVERAGETVEKPASGKGLGRKGGAKAEKAPETKPAETVAHTAPAESVEPGTASGAPVGLIVYVDAISTSEAEDLAPYVTKACADLAAEFKAADVRCAPPDSPLGFGKWKGALHAFVRAEPPPAGRYFLHFVKGNEIREVVADALREVVAEHGGEFVRGI